MRNFAQKLLGCQLTTQHMLRAICVVVLSNLAAVNVQAADHAISMIGDLQHPPNFEKYSYTENRVQRDGELTEAKVGSFDNINPFTIRGAVAHNIRENIFESLMSRNMNAPFSLYGLLAEKLSVNSERSRISFRLNEQAKFSDGKAVRVEDVIYSWKVLGEQGRPNHRYYYQQVLSAEKTGPRDITFTFKGPPFDRELPLIIGLMPILPEHIYKDRDLQESSFDTPIGSGPYQIASVTPGRQVIFERNPDYWGKDLNVNRGRYNFMTITHDYYRDETSAFEAFKTGAVDIWFETDPLRWKTGFEFPAARDGRVIVEELETGTPSGLQAFVLNSRRPHFADADFRQALDYLFDFEWANKTLYAGGYERTVSYFGNTALSAHNVAANAREMKLVKKTGLPDEALNAGYQPPTSDGSGRDRNSKRAALKLIKKAGYSLDKNVLVDNKGVPIKMEILVQRKDHERLALAYKRMLGQLGIEVNIRLVDASQYQRRLQNFDFDIIIYDYYASLSPGNEQAYYWSSSSADTLGSRNYAGVKERAIDDAIEALTQAKTVDDYQAAARAIDRVLLGKHYMIPLFHRPRQWVARWSTIERPIKTPIYGAQIDSWWQSLLN
ncbi:extracellular solute-binding protein [Alphaproteobacteria bacterium]|jgi:peptide/nickel transport system substrate-binding protein|nr:extracellular solute-binding protein [Alphaproteobacteria bacterium]